MQTLLPLEPEEPVTSAVAATPMMTQYFAVKEKYKDCLLFYRLGDFYELFFEDAITASAALDLTLTRRSHHKGEEVPMCGVPWHSHESYLARLIRMGYKVAICEQSETPEEAKKRGGYKALVQRDVVRVVTGGTLTEDTLLEKNAHNYLAALSEIGGDIGAAWLDVSTGDFMLETVALKSLSAALERMNPSEILLPEKLVQNPELFDTFQPFKSKLTLQPPSRFDSENAKKRLQALFAVGTLEGFGGFSRVEISAAGALVEYVDLTQKGKIPRLSPPKKLTASAFMEIDAATRRNLELTQTLNGERQGSLLHTIDRTITGAGARLLAKHLALPLTTPQNIENRLDMVEFFTHHAKSREDVRKTLQECADIERSLSRLSVERGGPRDLAAIRDTLARALNIHRSIFSSDKQLPIELQAALAALEKWGSHHPLINHLERALGQDLPVLTRDGGFIARGYSPKLDELKKLRDDSRQLIANLQASYTRKTGVQTLKIKHNNVIGYFIEVGTSHADKLFSNGGDFIHRQTLASAARFTTVELTELERKISESAEKSLALELELYAALVQETLTYADSISDAATALAHIDVAAALAELAVAQRYTRPIIDDSVAFSIEGGRHPVVEAALRKTGTADFIANTCTMTDSSRLWLLTGPNMAGKSTFLRQNALITLLAQIGSFVPAEKAHIGVVDRLFSRVGAADDLARGRSTFMVEMVETAVILNQATPRSLVILDEIGRGTATYDGLSIAWACLEYLHDVNTCRALFATHYHELTGLTTPLPRLSCRTMKVKEWKDSIVFLHEVGEGTADRSYGVHVAQLAGLPPAVIARAEQVLHTLESADTGHGKPAALQSQLPAFNPAQTKKAEKEVSAVEQKLKTIDPDSLTPKLALEALYELRGLLKNV